MQPVTLDKYDLSGNVIILTGATDGIGKDMARILAGFNPKRLILPARNKEKGKILLEYIKTSNGNADNVEVWEMDLADLQSVKNFANKFINQVGELHMLFNNAGVWINSKETVQTTKDNLEMQFQVNHLAPFFLTTLLLDTVRKSVSAELPGKLAFTSSMISKLGEIDFDNLNHEKGSYWHPFKDYYANTKLMNIVTSNEFGRIVQNENIMTYSFHPGVIKTNVGHENEDFISKFTSNLFVKTMGITIEQGAINSLYPVLANNESGKYYHDGIEQEPNKLAHDQELAKKLWSVSEQLLKDRGMI